MSSQRRWRRWLLVIGSVVLLFTGGAFAFVRTELAGAHLADKIASALNKRMRGRIEVGSVEWPTSSLEAVVTGGWVPVRIHDVKLWDDCVLSGASPPRGGDPNVDCTPDDRPDPDPASKRRPRKLLIAVPLITTEIDLHALMLGHHDFAFRHTVVHGGQALLEQGVEPYPLHAYDRTIITIVSAFYPRMKAGFRAGMYADKPPPIFDLHDIHAEHVDVTAHLGPYTNSDGTIGYAVTARLEDVNADGDSSLGEGTQNYLHMDATDPLIATFYVRLALAAAHGRIRVRDEGPRDAFRLPAPGAPWAARRTAAYDVQLSNVVLHKLAQVPKPGSRFATTLELDLEAHTLPCGGDASAGADLHISGAVRDYWARPYDGRWDLALDIANLGPTLHTCGKPMLGGDNLGGRLTLTGPFVAPPKVGVELHGLDVDLALARGKAPLRLTLAEVKGDIDLVNDEGAIEQTRALVRGGSEPGEIAVSATFGLKPYNARASIDIEKPIDIGRFLPSQVATGVGGYFGGKLTAVGDVDTGFALESFDLSLGPAPADRLVRVHRGRIFTSNAFDTIGIQRVTVEAGKSHAVFDGTVDTAKQQLSIRIDGDFPDLDVWLKRFGLPAFATSAGGGAIVISGPLKSPNVGVKLNLGGVPCMDSLTLDADVKDGIATVNQVTSSGLGGALSGHGVVTLGDTKVIQSFHIEGKRLDASRLCGLAGIVKGVLDDVAVDLNQTPVVPNRPAIDWLAYVSAFARADHLAIAGDAYSSLALCVNRPDDSACRDANGDARLGPDDPATCDAAKHRTGGACVVARGERDLGGRLAAMVIDVPATKTAPRHLAGTLAIDDIPLAIADQFIGKGVLGGLLSATLHLQGGIGAPQAQGSLALIRSWLKNGFIGDSDLQVSPIMVGKTPSVFLHGTALAGQVQIRATIGTEAPYAVEAVIDGRRVELDTFLALDKLLGTDDPIQAWASGTVTIRTELAPLDHKPREPEAWVELNELTAIVDHHARDGRITPLSFALAPKPDGFALSMHLTREAVELACRDLTAQGGRRPCSTELVTPAGVVAFEGGASTAQMNVKATGQLLLARLQPLFATQLDAIAGTLDLDASLAGTFDAPKYQAELLVHDRVQVRPTGGDTALEVEPGGQLRFANGTLGFNQLAIGVSDEHASAAHAAGMGELHVRGAISFAGLTPSAWGVQVDGTIAGKLLLALAPNAVAQASGAARIAGALSLSGKGAWPDVQGTVAFDGSGADDGPAQPSPLSVSLRGARHEVTLLGGGMDIGTQPSGDHKAYTLAIATDPITASVDGEGKVENVRGHLVIDGGAPTEAVLDLDAEALPFRIPGSLDLVVSARDMELALLPGRATWSARGNISIISGAYTRNFEVTDAIKPVASTAPPPKPVWDEYPTIGSTQLDLTLDVRRFQVKNNIARNGIDLEGPRIRISGTPRDPRLSGSIRVQRGEFQIPGTRATFTRTLGSIDFAENEKATNPRLDITSDSDYTDLSGQLHIITLTINGTLENPQWDLKTSTGYNKSQTLTLLFLGRNPEQIRRSLGDQSLGADPTRIDPTTNPSTGFADEIVKDLAGDWVSGLIGDKLTKLTRLDVLRFEIGFGTIGIYAERKFAENIKVIGDFEQTIRGQTINITGSFKTPWHLPWHQLTNDQFTIEGVYLSINYYDPAEEDIKDYRGQIVYRLFIPPLFP